MLGNFSQTTVALQQRLLWYSSSSDLPAGSIGLYYHHTDPLCDSTIMLNETIHIEIENKNFNFLKKILKKKIKKKSNFFASYIHV